MLTLAESIQWVYACSLYNSLSFSVFWKFFLIKYGRKTHVCVCMYKYAKRGKASKGIYQHISTGSLKVLPF